MKLSLISNRLIFSLLLLYSWWHMKATNKTVQAECGHLTKIRKHVTLFGETKLIELELKNGRAEYCYDCLLVQVIQCAWCHRSIFPNDFITTYEVVDSRWTLPPLIGRDAETGRYLGCVRRGCLELSGHPEVTGLWVMPGEVLKAKTPIPLKYVPLDVS